MIPLFLSRSAIQSLVRQGILIPGKRPNTYRMPTYLPDHPPTPGLHPHARLVLGREVRTTPGVSSRRRRDGSIEYLYDYPESVAYRRPRGFLVGATPEEATAAVPRTAPAYTSFRIDELLHGGFPRYRAVLKHHETRRPVPGKPVDANRRRRGERKEVRYRKLLRFVNRTYGRADEGRELVQALQSENPLETYVANQALDFYVGSQNRLLRDQVLRPMGAPWWLSPVVRRL